MKNWSNAASVESASLIVWDILIVGIALHKEAKGLQDFMVYRDALEMINRLADMIIGEMRSVEEVYGELVKTITHVFAMKYACVIHYSLDKSVNPVTCDICPTLFFGSA